MFFELFLLREISEFPSGIWTHNRQIARDLTGDLKVVGSNLGYPAWELRNFSEQK